MSAPKKTEDKVSIEELRERLPRTPYDRADWLEKELWKNKNRNKE